MAVAVSNICSRVIVVPPPLSDASRRLGRPRFRATDEVLVDLFDIDQGLS